MLASPPSWNVADMIQPLRFGRRLPIPSKRQIIHEMRVMQAEEERLKAVTQPAAQPLAEVPIGPDGTGSLP